ATTAVLREPTPPSARAAAVVTPKAMLAPTALGDRWNDVVTRLAAAGSISALVRELAMQAQCVAIDGAGAASVWRLRVERDNLRTPAHCEKLQAALSDLLQHALRLDLEAGEVGDSPAQRAAAERARRQAEAEQIIHDDPLVQTLMQQFKTARIVPGSVKPH
ncbi:MAG TPA: DNA polymerase III subunit gamma/tau C-terminal domain-containing protein, partial [Rhizobacter sp.]|nr:DNA polymerase III subunit gamma/tau C-terminal domain-containing protein [Rhizobacter sp.]